MQGEYVKMRFHIPHKFAFPIFGVLAFLCFNTTNVFCQYVNVTAQVKDVNGNLYQNCHGEADFVPSSSATTQPFLSGSLFQTSFVINQCDGNANFTLMGLADNNQVSDGHGGGPVSQWRFTICSSGTPVQFSVCFSYTTTITGATQNISSGLQAASAPLLQQGSILSGTSGNLAKYGSSNVVSDSGIAANNVPLLNGNNALTGNETHSGSETFSGTEIITGPVSGTRTDSGNVTYSGSGVHSGGDSFTGTASFTGAVPANFYVATTGSDSNDCLASSGSPHGPCLTVQHAANVAMSYVFAGVSATVNIGTGTFQGPTLSGFLMGNAGPNVNTAFLVLNGNGAANTVLTDTMSHTYVIDVSGGMQLTVENMNISVPANESGIFAQLPGSFVIVTGTTTFTGAASSSVALHAEDYAAISLQNGTTTTNGSFGYFATIGQDGQLGSASTAAINCGTVTTFSTAFAFLDGNSTALFTNTWSGCGAVTGTQYSIGGNSYINNTTGSHLPGSLAGQVYAGGRYRPSPLIIAAEPDGHLGTGGSVSVATGSGSHGGLLTLNTGSAATSSSGVVAFSWSELQVITGGTVPAPCTASPQSASAAWNAQAAMQIAINSSAGGLQIQWSNNAVNLTVGTTYAIAYVCGGDI